MDGTEFKFPDISRALWRAEDRKEGKKRYRLTLQQPGPLQKRERMSTARPVGHQVPKGSRHQGESDSSVQVWRHLEDNDL